MKLYLLAFFAICFQLANAQNITKSISENIPSGGSLGLTKIGNSYVCYERLFKSNNIINVKLSKFRYSLKLRKLDANFKVITENSLSNLDQVYGPYQPSYKVVGEKLFLIYYQFVGPDETMKLYASEVNLSTMELSTPTELMDIQQAADGKYESIDIYLKNPLLIQQSPDRSKNVILWQSGAENKLFFYTVTTPDFKVIRTGKEEIKDAKQISIKSIAISNAGTLYIPYSCTKKSDLYAYIYTNSSDNITNSIEVKDPGTGIPAIFISTLPDNNLAITGTYSYETDIANGVFYLTLNTGTNELTPMKKTVFPDAIITQLNKQKWTSVRKNKSGIFVPMIDFNIHQLDDGGISLLGQFERVEFGQMAGFNIYGSIFNIYLKDGVCTFSIIPKLRVSVTVETGSSFYPFVYKNKLLVFYNDSRDNLQRDISDEPFRSDKYNNHVLVVANIERDGSVKRDVLIDQTEDHLLGNTENIYNYSNDSFIIPFNKVSSTGSIGDWVNWATVQIK